MSNTMPPASPVDSDDSWLTADEVSDAESVTPVQPELSVAGKIVADIGEPLPVFGRSGETATLVQAAIKLKHRYRILTPGDMDKSGHPVPDAVGEGANTLLCSDKSGRFLGMLVEKASTPDNTEPEIARLSKKSEYAVGKLVAKDPNATETMLCKWASNLASAPDNVREGAEANNGYLIADYLVAKRKSQNAARATKAAAKKGQTKQTKLKRPRADDEPKAAKPAAVATPVKAKPREQPKDTPPPTARAEAALPANPPAEVSAGPPPKRRCVITIENPDAEDLKVLLRKL